MTPSTNPPDTWSTWARSKADQFLFWFYQEFNKLLLVLLLCVLFVIILHGLHDPSHDKDSIHWFREQANTVMGCLLGLITGVRIGMSIGEKKEQVTVTKTSTDTTDTHQ